MAAWALSVLEAQTPELWAAEMAFVAACPAAAMDEVGGWMGGWAGNSMGGWAGGCPCNTQDCLFVRASRERVCVDAPARPCSACCCVWCLQVTLIHLWQAAMFADRAAVTTAVGPGGGAAAIVPRMRSASGAAGCWEFAGRLQLLEVAFAAALPLCWSVACLVPHWRCMLSAQRCPPSVGCRHPAACCRRGASHAGGWGLPAAAHHQL